MSKTTLFPKATLPKMRPILMSAPMVLATLEGRKTQTRRIIKPQPSPWGLSGRIGDTRIFRWKDHAAGNDWTEDGMIALCPYGKVGGRLWVRETFFCNSFDYPVSILTGSSEPVLRHLPSTRAFPMREA